MRKIGLRTVAAGILMDMKCCRSMRGDIEPLLLEAKGCCEGGPDGHPSANYSE